VRSDAESGGEIALVRGRPVALIARPHPARRETGPADRRIVDRL
jgi:hypothetical protein